MTKRWRSSDSTSLARGDPPDAEDELPEVELSRPAALTRFQRLVVPILGTASAVGAQQLPVGEDWRDVLADLGINTTSAGCKPTGAGYKPTFNGGLTGIALAFASGMTGHGATEPDFGGVRGDARGDAAAEDVRDCAGSGAPQPGGARTGHGGGVQPAGAPGGGGGGADMRVARCNACAASATRAASAACERGVRITATLPRGDAGLLCTAGIAQQFATQAKDRGFNERAAAKCYRTRKTD